MKKARYYGSKSVVDYISSIGTNVQIVGQDNDGNIMFDIYGVHPFHVINVDTLKPLVDVGAVDVVGNYMCVDDGSVYWVYRYTDDAFQDFIVMLYNDSDADYSYPFLNMVKKFYCV